MKKFFLLLVAFVFLMWGTNSQTFAQPTASADGLFGSYFLRITNPCVNKYSVITGFDNVGNNFWERKCTDIQDILKNIPNGTRVEIGQSGGNVDIVVNGKITQTQKPSENDKNALITREMLDEILKAKVPNIHIGYATGKNMQYIKFPDKKFKTTPSVIVMPTGFSRWASCERIRWEFVAQPQNVTKDGFSFNFQFANRGCGGLHLHTIAYVAIENIDSVALPILNHVTMSDMEEDSNGEDRITKLEKEVEELKKIIKEWGVASNSNGPIYIQASQSFTMFGEAGASFTLQSLNPSYSGTVIIKNNRKEVEKVFVNGKANINITELGFHWSVLTASCDSPIDMNVISMMDKDTWKSIWFTSLVASTRRCK